MTTVAIFKAIAVVATACCSKRFLRHFEVRCCFVLKSVLSSNSMVNERLVVVEGGRRNLSLQQPLAEETLLISQMPL